MKNIKPLRQIITPVGGPNAVVDALADRGVRVKPKTIEHWVTMGVPDAHVLPLHDALEALGSPVDLQSLRALAASRVRSAAA